MEHLQSSTPYRRFQLGPAFPERFHESRQSDGVGRSCGRLQSSGGTAKILQSEDRGGTPDGVGTSDQRRMISREEEFVEQAHPDAGVADEGIEEFHQFAGIDLPAQSIDRLSESDQIDLGSHASHPRQSVPAGQAPVHAL
jgi:hypothetical protein